MIINVITSRVVNSSHSIINVCPDALIFKLVVFDYMLSTPVSNTLQIQQLESVTYLSPLRLMSLPCNTHSTKGAYYQCN